MVFRGWYCPTLFEKEMVVPARFERATFRFGGEYSIQLSYGTIVSVRVPVQVLPKDPFPYLPNTVRPNTSASIRLSYGSVLISVEVSTGVVATALSTAFFSFAPCQGPARPAS